MNFLANLASDALLAVAVYFIVTQPGEKRKVQQSQERALGLLKSESELNLSRARAYSSILENPFDINSKDFPLRFTRGAWNSLRESGFLSELD